MAANDDGIVPIIRFDANPNLVMYDKNPIYMQIIGQDSLKIYPSNLVPLDIYSDPILELLSEPVQYACHSLPKLAFCIIHMLFFYTLNELYREKTISK